MEGAQTPLEMAFKVNFMAISIRYRQITLLRVRESERERASKRASERETDRQRESRRQTPLERASSSLPSVSTPIPRLPMQIAVPVSCTGHTHLQSHASQQAAAEPRWNTLKSLKDFHPAPMLPLEPFSPEAGPSRTGPHKRNVFDSTEYLDGETGLGFGVKGLRLRVWG